MFSRKAVMTAAVVLTMAGASTEAMAATVQVSVNGTVTSGSDMTGLFGAPGGTLDGQAFTLTYTIDTALGFRDNQGPTAYDAVYGGGLYGTASPTISASLSIGGHTQTIAGQSEGSYYVCDAQFCGSDTFSANAGDYDYSSPLWLYNSIGLYFADSAATLPDTLDSSFTFNPSPTGYSSGNFIFQAFDSTTWTYQTLTQGSLSVASVSVAAVPLSATGLALVGALGGLGLFSRRRRLTA